MILKGINDDLIDIAAKAMSIRYADIRLCELGNQEVPWSPYKTGKRYLLAQGIKEHVSIDINGKDGALKIDLGKPIRSWYNYFDICTNFGTLEHVKDNIYTGLENVHNLVRIGGAMIHLGPHARGWEWHSPYHYEPWFFDAFSNACGYTSVLTEVRLFPRKDNHMKREDSLIVCSILLKNPKSHFLTPKELKDLGGIAGLS